MMIEENAEGQADTSTGLQLDRLTKEQAERKSG
jgi:hypothetical protein